MSLQGFLFPTVLGKFPRRILARVRAWTDGMKHPVSHIKAGVSYAGLPSRKNCLPRWRAGATGFAVSRRRGRRSHYSVT